MALTILLTVLIVSGGNILLLLILRRAYNREKQALLDAAQSYFTAEREGEPSQFGLFVQLVTDNAVSRLVTTLKSTFMGMQSVDKRNLDRLDQDLVQDLASQQSPIAGALLAAFPAVGRRLAKNPALGMAVQALLSKAGNKQGAGAGAPPDNGHSSNDFASRLGRYGG